MPAHRLREQRRPVVLQPFVDDFVEQPFEHGAKLLAGRHAERRQIIPGHRELP